jgi:hypothetical protein
MPLIILVLVPPPVLLDTVVARPVRSCPRQMSIHSQHQLPVQLVRRALMDLLLTTTTPFALIVPPANIPIKPVSLLTPNVKNVPLANIPIKPVVLLTLNVQDDVPPASTPTVPAFLRTVTVPFVPPGNGPLKKVSPPTDRVFFALLVNSPIKPVSRRTPNVKDNAQVVHIPVLLE